MRSYDERPEEVEMNTEPTTTTELTPEEYAAARRTAFTGLGCLLILGVMLTPFLVFALAALYMLIFGG